MQKRMTAKYDGMCHACGGFVRLGTPIVYDTDTRRAAHATCPATPEPKPVRVFTTIDAGALQARLAACRDALHALDVAAAAASRACAAAAEKAFLAAGGCGGCMGVGSVRASADSNLAVRGEWYRCPDCRDATPVRYDASAASLFHPLGDACRAYAAATRRTLVAECDALARQLHVERFTVVRVARGRAVPRGTEGVVIWKGHGRFGPRVGVKDAEGTVHWTAAANCDVIGLRVEQDAA